MRCELVEPLLQRVHTHMAIVLLPPSLHPLSHIFTLVFKMPLCLVTPLGLLPCLSQTAPVIWPLMLTMMLLTMMVTMVMAEAVTTIMHSFLALPAALSSVLLALLILTTIGSPPFLP